MIIDREGNILSSFNLDYGIIKHVNEWAICLTYKNEEDVTRTRELNKITSSLSKTDYITTKYIEGAISEEKWEEHKKERADLRARYNELEALITIPTITEEEIEEAIRKGKENYKKETGQDYPEA